MMPTLLLVAQLLVSARAEVVVLELEGMICVACEQKVQTALDALDFLAEVDASTAGGKACAELTGALDTAAIQTAITEVGYTIIGQDLHPECPDISAASRVRNWADTAGLDATIISTGEPIELDAHLVAGKFTIYDFGAVWCGPCHTAETMLKTYMATHEDVAVRAIVLAGNDPKTSFAHPVVRQHLGSAAGLPYFIVYSPEGAAVYRGVDPARALKKIDRKRR